MQKLILLTLLTLTLFLSTTYSQANISSNNPNFITNPYHPIMLTWKNDNGLFSDGNVIGGSQGNKWFRLESFDVTYQGKIIKLKTFKNQYSNSVENKEYGRIDLVTGNEMFKLYSLNKNITTIKAEKCGLYTQWSTGDEMLGVHFKPFKADEEFLIGVNGNWNAIPKVLKPLNENSYSVDIDKDGHDEILSIKETGRGKPYKTSVTLSFEIKKMVRK